MAGKRNIGTWAKMLVGGSAICVGGPALTFWLQPTDEELFERYSPELKKKSLERRHERQQEFDDFVTKLKEYSKSDKPIWVVQQEEARKFKEDKLRQDTEAAREAQARKEAMRKESGLS